MKKIIPAVFCALLVLHVVGAQEPTASPAASTPPTITTQPANATVKVGTKATFSVKASGTTPLSYQWYKWGNAISGATASQYTTPPTTDADNNMPFYVVVSNQAGNATSNTVYLTVVDPPVITQQPQSLTVAAPAIATFTVWASGWPIKYQWFRNGVTIKGATDYSYSVTETTAADNGAKFTVTLTNAAASVTSKPAILTVTPYAGTGTYPIVGEWSGTASVNGGKAFNVVAGFWQTSYSIAGTIIFTDDEGIPEMGSGIASLNNLNLSIPVGNDGMNLAAGFTKDLLTLTGEGLSYNGEGGMGTLTLSADRKTLSGTATITDGTKLTWKLTRTK